MLKSMTGFGKGDAAVGAAHYEVQCKSVNSRYLEVGLKLPLALWEWEGEAKKLFNKVLSRGKVDVYWKDLASQNQNKTLQVDIALARAYQEAFAKVAGELGLENNLRADSAARYPDVIAAAAADLDSEELIKQHWQSLKEAIQKAVQSLDEARAREGQALMAEFELQLAAAETLVDEIEIASDEAKEAFKEKVRLRLEKILERIPADDPRLVMEVGVLADKADIREELVRFRTHVEEFKRLLNSGKPSGKQLDFLSQELLRETNTMGSKSPEAALSHKVVSLKSVVESIKEQILNVE